MSDVDTEDLDALADLYQALGNKTRLSVLLQLSQDKPVSQLTDELGITRSGLQKNIERLIDSELVYRPQEDDSNTYELTPLGHRYITLVEKESSEALDVLQTLETELEDLEEENQDTRETLEDAGVDLTEFEQKLKSEAWQNIWEEAQDKLE
jgi:DNA-binding MarR family transcriptional regulator